jgi:hypothetical protein
VFIMAYSRKFIVGLVRDYMSENGHTVTGFAESIGVKPATLNNFLSRESVPSKPRIEVLHRIFAVVPPPHENWEKVHQSAEVYPKGDTPVVVAPDVVKIRRSDWEKLVTKVYNISNYLHIQNSSTNVSSESTLVGVVFRLGELDAMVRGVDSTVGGSK